MMVRKGSRNPFLQKKSMANPISSRMKDSMPPHTELRPSVSMNRVVDNAPKSNTQLFVSKELYEMEPILVVLDSNCNLDNIHTEILKYFKEIKNRLLHLKKSIPIVKEFIKSSNDHFAKQKYERQLFVIEEEIKSLNSLSRLDYSIKIKPCLEEFRELRKDMGISVMGEKKQSNQYYLESRKIMVIEKFLDIAIQYCSVIKIERPSFVQTCYKCGEELIETSNDLQCIHCGISQECLEIIEELENGGKKITVRRTGVADTIKNFRDIVDQFEVTSNINIPAKIIDSIRENVLKYRNFEIQDLNKVDLVSIMKSMKINSMWFKHLNKIHFILTGKRPRSIQEHIPNLMRRIECFADIYEEIKEEGRSNFIHGLHIFWMFLMNEGYEVDPDDFVLLKSRDVEMNNIRTLEKGFKILRESNPEFQWKIFEIA